MKTNVTVVLFSVVSTLALCPGPGYSQDKRYPRGNRIPPEGDKIARVVTKIVDACQFASADQLKALIGGGIKSYFPLKDSKPGHYVTISDPVVTGATCSPFSITIKAKVRYKDTRGIDQHQSSGEVRFTSPLVVKVTYNQIAVGASARAGDLVKASACLTDMRVTGLNLKNVPNWLDDGWIKDKLNKELANKMCFDVTDLVRLYLQQGKTL